LEASLLLIKNFRLLIKHLVSLTLVITLLLINVPLSAEFIENKAENGVEQQSLIVKFKKSKSPALSSIDFDALGLDSEKFTAVFGSLDKTTVLAGGASNFTSGNSLAVQGLEKYLQRQQKAKEIEASYGFDRVYKVSFESREELKKAKKALKANLNVESVEEDITIYTQATANDPFYNLTDANPDNLWGIKAMKSSDAWDINQGEGSVVAVLDTGVDYNLVDLWSNIWVNPALVSDSNSDRIIDLNDLDVNPKDGKISGTELSSRVRQFVLGYDYINNDSDPIDDHYTPAYRSGGHGTHVSGTIAAVINNSIGVVGVSPKAKIMCMKVLNSAGSGDLSAAANAMKQAADNGADVINMSLGARASTPGFLLDAVNYAQALGTVVIVAAGNDGADAAKYTPAGIPSVITVAALDKNFKAASFSNFGSLIDISAPGVEIISTSASVVRAANPIEYIRYSGTSMAAPHVAGVAALIKASEPSLTLEQVQQRIRNAFSAPDTASEQLAFLRSYFTSRVKPIVNSFLALKNKATAEISSVSLNTKLVQGTASAANFARYELSYMPNLDGSAKTLLFKGFTPVVKAPLFNNLVLDKAKDNFLILEVFDNTGVRVAFDAKRLEPSSLSTASNVFVSIAPNPAEIGKSVLLVAAVSGANPTGTITFVDTKNPSAIATINLTGTANSKSVSYNATFLTLGDRTISATYSGDAKNDPAGSAPINFSVVKANTTTRLSLPSGVAEPNKTINLTATVTGFKPSGNVVFTDTTNNRVLGTVALVSTDSAGTANLSVSFSTVGTRSISAAYAGDLNNNASSSALFSLAVKTTPSISLKVTPAIATVGQPLALTATVVANTLNTTFPIGTVNFFDNGVSVGSVNLTGSAKTSTATLNQIFSQAGKRTITAAYSGDASNNAVSSASFDITLSKANSTTKLTINPNIVTAGQTTVLTANVTGINQAGSVRFTDATNSTVLGISNLTGIGNSKNAVLSVAIPNTATKSIIATYSGDANNNVSSSPATAITVNKASALATVTANTLTAGLRQLVNFTASITGVNPTGSVDFTNASNQVLGSILLSGTANLKTAVFSASFNSIGNQVIKAVYKGDLNNSTVTSAPVTVSVKIAPAITLQLTPNAVNAGDLVQAQIQLTNLETLGAFPTGTVEIKDGGVVLGRVNLSGSVKSSSASISVPITLSGTRFITAVYLGDTNFMSVTSVPVLVQVKQTAIVSIIPTGISAKAGFSTNIIGLVYGTNPTGSVSFTDSRGTNYGTAALTGFGHMKSASIIARFNTRGTYTITANYLGDAANAPGKSTVLTVNVL
jgi:subtilisin family serine protease